MAVSDHINASAFTRNLVIGGCGTPQTNWAVASVFAGDLTASCVRGVCVVRSWVVIECSLMYPICVRDRHRAMWINVIGQDRRC